LYQIRNGEIRKITHDHSPVGEREDARELTEAEAMRHPRRNEVFRDVGSEEHAPDDANFIEIRHIDLEPDSALVLCSDGLSDLVASDTIRGIVERRSGDPEAAARELIDAANRAGGKDNVTVVVVQGEQFRASAPPAVDAGGGRPGWALPLALGMIAIAIATLAAAIWLRGDSKPAQPVAVLPRVWEVGPGQGTIAEAIAQAQPRDRIVVRAGEYREQIVMKSGISIVADPPRGAILRAVAGGQGPAVVAEKVQNARLSGFSIQASAPMPLSAGIVLSESSVEIDDVEVSGAEVGVVIRGGNSSLRGSLIRECAIGVLATGPAQPWISHNGIVKNRKAGIAAADGARPALSGNVFDANKLELPPDMEMKLVQERNFFVGSQTMRGGRRP
jgi:hypothetical protein